LTAINSLSLTIGSADAAFVVFRPSEIAASVALAAIGECRSSVIERAPTKPFGTYLWIVASECNACSNSFQISLNIINVF
jgi:hypothetical protein